MQNNLPNINGLDLRLQKKDLKILMTLVKWSYNEQIKHIYYKDKYFYFTNSYLAIKWQANNIQEILNGKVESYKIDFDYLDQRYRLAKKASDYILFWLKDCKDLVEKDLPMLDLLDWLFKKEVEKELTSSQRFNPSLLNNLYSITGIDTFELKKWNMFYWKNTFQEILLMWLRK